MSFPGLMSELHLIKSYWCVSRENRSRSLPGAARANRWMRLAFCLIYVVPAQSLLAQQPVPQTTQSAILDQQFKYAVSAYESRRYAETLALLKALLSKAPKSFEVHELLGLTYAAQSEPARAVSELGFAVQLEPSSLMARNNLANALVQNGEIRQAEVECRSVLKVSPQDYEANHTLAQSLLREKKIDDAIPLLERAQRARPTAYNNGYDLALAYLLAGNFRASRELVGTLSELQDSGELHTLLGRLDEKEGKFLEAAHEFAAASRLDASEDNLFVWASELLLHRAYESAIEVFKSSTQRYPKSARLWIGLGMSQYSRGEYDEAIHSLMTAADLNPSDPRCYLFLSKAFLSSPNQAQSVIDHFQNYAAIEPNNALAQFYYAIAVWKGRRVEGPAIDYPKVEAILQRSIALNGAIAETHLQLGILYNDEHAYERALPEYERAVQLDPGLADAHFRLGRLYLRGGEKAKAERELDLFKTLQAQHQAELDKERADVQQFVVADTAAPPSER